MSQQILPERDEVALEPLIDAPDIRLGPPTPESATTPVTAPAGRSRLGVVLALAGTGLLMQGAADALERTGHDSPALPLFLCGIALLFAACAWRLTGTQASRKERVWVSLVLGLGLFASYVMHHPLLLDSFDELLHLGTLEHLLDSRAVFPTNTVLPVSPYYPGLELATAATRWLTGLPLVVDQLIVLAAVRIVLVLGIFLVTERACRSSRAGGIGVLVYAASPQFYGFDAQYAYETLGLAFAVAVVYLLFASIDAARPRMGRLFALALGCIGAVVITHHVTSWLTVSFLVVWAAGLYFTAHFRRRPTPAGGEPPVATEQQLMVQGSTMPDLDPRGRRRAQARIVGMAAAIGVVVCGAWTVYVGRLLSQYVGPVFAAASADISEALGNGHGNRTLFKNAAGGGSPDWEILLILVSAIGWCVILVPSLWSVIVKRSVRGGALRYLPAVIAAIYPLSLLANVSSSSKLVAERATTFIFFGVAVVVAAWLARRISRDRRFMERAATIAVATVVFVGSLLFGIGPPVDILPGPYRVGGDDLSLGAPSLAVAHWAATHLPAGSHVAADRDNGVLLNAIGGVDLVTSQSGLLNPELLWFDRPLSLYDIYLIRKADIRYIVIDDRLAQGLPLYGTYVADGEPSTRLTLGQLNKYNSYRFIKRIYDNGPIQVYDLTSLLPPSYRAAPAGPPAGGTGVDVGVLCLAAVVAGSWLLRLRRRSEPFHDLAHLVLCGVVGALLIGVFGALLVRLTHVQPEAAAIGVLAVLLALSLRPRGWHPGDVAARIRRRRTQTPGPSTSPTSPTLSPVAPHAEMATVGSPSDTGPADPASSTASAATPRRNRSQLLLGGLGLLLFALGASLATVSSLKEWTPPPELSIATKPPELSVVGTPGLSALSGTTGQSVAEVQLGSAGPIRRQPRSHQRWQEGLDHPPGTDHGGSECPDSKRSAPQGLARAAGLGWAQPATGRRLTRSPAGGSVGLGRSRLDLACVPGAGAGQGERVQNDAELVEDLEIRHARCRPDEPEEGVCSHRQLDRQELGSAQGAVDGHGWDGDESGPWLALTDGEARQ